MNVNLQSLADALNRQTADMTLYLDRATGKIVAVTDEDAALAADKVEWADLPGDRQAAVQTARAVSQSRGRAFIALPDAADMNERGLMREFIEEIELDHPVAAEDLTGAMRSRTPGAPRFRETVARYGLGNAWDAARADALQQILLAWCNENGLECKDAPRSDDSGVSMPETS